VFSPIVENTSTKNLFFKIVRAGFSQPRKQIANNLSKVLKLDKEKIKYWLKRNNISYSQRAETLAIKDWLKLTKNWYKI
jgi:16S rRNA (adenine1518-N6/adenine1519-N6)-dimethyltransferase